MQKRKLGNSKLEVSKAGINHVLVERTAAPCPWYARFRVYSDVAVGPAKALMVDLPHASIHRD
jgi:hypothetical protein